MQFFNSTDTELSLYHDTLFLLGLTSSDTTTFPVDGDFTRSVNDWYRRVVFWIWRSTADWEFDDSNISASQTDNNWTYSGTQGLPVATRDMVGGTQDYGLPTNALSIERVEVANSSSPAIFQLVHPLDKTQVKVAISELYPTDGLPHFYDLMGTVIRLFPAPLSTSVTLTAGLRIYVSRDIDAFTPADTSQEPAFDNKFHKLLSLGPALDFALRKTIKDKIPLFRGEIEILRRELEEFYSKRHSRNFKTKIRPLYRQYI